MKIKPQLVSLFAILLTICGVLADESEQSHIKNGTGHILTATDMSIATGKPSLVNMSVGSVHIPVWSLSGMTAGQSVVGIVDGFSDEYVAAKVEIVVTTTDNTTSTKFEDVYKVHLTQMKNDTSFAAFNSTSEPVRTNLPVAPYHSRKIVLESFYHIEANTPIVIRIQRDPKDPADSFVRPTGLAMVKVTPLKSLPKPLIVENSNGYNSWPMIEAIGEKLVCMYSRGSLHTINEDKRAVYARTSMDMGKTWTAETVIANTPGYGEVAVGKGLDSSGALLLWVRRAGAAWLHDLYRTTDGVKFELVATPKLEVTPVQITDIFEVPTVGLMSLWFAGSYNVNDTSYSWGTLVSSDNGKTWKQKTIESKLTHSQWPAEPAGVYLGDGKILAIGRTEMSYGSSEKSQFQMVSSDFGATWKRKQTNISDVLKSTSSLILDEKTGLLYNYYYQRGPNKGILRRRVVDSKKVFNDPLAWPASEAVAIGSQATIDAGNANATKVRGAHVVTFYSGKNPNTSIVLSVLPTGE